MKLTKRLQGEIRAHANASLYRLNAPSANCYAFSIVRNAKGKIDFEGGWDWQNSLVNKKAEYIYDLRSNRFIKILKEVD